MRSIARLVRKSRPEPGSGDHSTKHTRDSSKPTQRLPSSKQSCGRDGFCSDCQKIDWRRACSIKVEETTDNRRRDLVIADLGTRCNKLPINGCKMCRFLYEARFSEAAGEYDGPHQLSAYSFVDFYYGFDKAKAGAGEENDRVCFMVHPDRGTSVQYRFFPQIPLLWFEKQGSSPQFVQAIPRPPSPDLSRIRPWLEYCRENHLACHRRTGRLQNLKVIDCLSSTVIKWPGDEFAALSYVWGSNATAADPNASRQRQSSSGFPRTVRDAITVTEALGLRYLWVDRYCIDQDNSKEREQQIRQMHLIYGQAVLTIIAAFGGDADAGLPGVNTRPRKQQPIVEIDDLLFVNTFPHPRYTVHNTTWATRGWTFQEAMISRRRLFFTEEQIYFECEGMSYYESIEFKQNNSHGWKTYKAYNIYDFGMFSEEAVEPRPARQEEYNFQRRYLPLRNEYSARNLSYDEDALNAFHGILEQLQSCWPRDMFRHVCGLPWIHHEESNVDDNLSFFVQGLLWSHGTPNQPIHRRSCFPSFSWVAWRGKVHAHSYLGDDMRSILAPDQFFLEFRSSGVVRFRDLRLVFKNNRLAYSDLISIAFRTGVIDFDSNKRTTFKNMYNIKIGNSSLNFGADIGSKVDGELHLSCGPTDATNVNALVRSGIYVLAPIFLSIEYYHGDLNSELPILFFLLLKDQGSVYERIGSGELKCDFKRLTPDLTWKEIRIT